MYKYSLNLLNG